MYDVSVSRRADELPEDWPGTPGGPPFYGLPWLRFYERAVTQAPRYVVVARGGETVATAVCALDAYLYIPYLPGAARGLAQRFFAPRVLSCELPTLERPGVWLHPDHAGAAAPVLAAALRELAAAERRPVVLINYVDETLHGSRAGWPGYVAQASEDDTCIDLEDASLEGYVARLGREGRRRLRNLPRRAQRADLVVDRAAPDDAAGAQLFELVRSVHAHHGEPGLAWRPGAFAALALLPQVVLRVVRAGARPVACEALLIDREDAAIKLFGLDYGAAFHDLDQLLSLAHIGDAIEAGVRRLWMGTTHMERKRDHFGARRVPRYTWASARGRYAVLLWAAGLR